jgi:8-amino-7-oxononanoate synthase
MRAKLASAARGERRHGVPEPAAQAGGQLVAMAEEGSAIVDGLPVANFVGAGYLGLDHGAWLRREVARRSDVALTLSAPRALATHVDMAALEQALAALVAQPAALIGPSTLHLLVDVLRELALPRGTALFDARSYPLALSALATAHGLGARTLPFRHRDPGALGRALLRCRPGPRVVVCDGLVAPGDPTPLRQYARLCEAAGATLVVDDTQGVGLLGVRPHPGLPYGAGGGGTALHVSCRSRSLVVVASLAKAFGVPLAFVAGPRELVGRLAARADFMWTSSPPDLVSVRAALAALEVNATTGDALRQRLSRNVAEFRAGAKTVARGSFPVQSWYVACGQRAAAAHRALLARGVWSILHCDPPDAPGRAALRFVVTAAHSEPILARALDAIRVVRRQVLA